MNNKMNELCDRGATVEQITRRVNGGTNGLAERKRYYERALRFI
jgi:putative chitinase